MQLALRLGRSLNELLLTVSSEELTMWRAFDLREPIGDWRNDLGFGIVASTLANIHRKESTEPFQPVAFMPLMANRVTTSSLASRLRAALMSHDGRRAKSSGVKQ